MRITLAAGLISIATSGLVVSGCTQMPTEKQSVTDMRPQISFKVVSDELRGARVLIDGLDTGTVGDYLEGVAALRVLSGVHVIKIHQAGRTVVEEKIYIGDGVSRSMLIE